MNNSYIRILWAGKTEYTRDSAVGKTHTHNYYQMYYAFGGEGELTVNDCAYRLTAGKALLVHPQSPHFLNVPDSLSVLEIKFESNVSGLSALPVALAINDDCKRVLGLIAEECEKQGTYYQSVCDNYLSICLFRMLRGETEPAAATVSAKIMAYVNEHYEEEINLDRLARSIGNNKNYICTAFKKENGLTIGDYLYKVRAIKAAELLRGSDYSLSHIAGMTGFKTIHHFNRVFAKTWGLPPGKYRRTYADEFGLDTEQSGLYRAAGDE